jgi:aspartyl-tRNA(Asn)/glutamyl-tRNA(Gln) amidotransferase subunit A
VTADLPVTAADAARRLRDGSVTSVALTQALLGRADRSDPELGVYLARFDEQALEQAQRADAELASGLDRGPFHGIPFGVKDIFAAAEGPTTANSLVLDPQWGAGRDATAVARMKQAGAVITGKVATMEFAVGTVDADKPFPQTRNPWDPNTWPGGSSSGTGAGVAAGFFLAGFGSDTGGSIRIPASYCGVSGLMPTFGVVPKTGVVPLGYSLDHVGPLARSVEDCAAVLEIIAGADGEDPDCVPSWPGLGTAWREGSLEGRRIGVVTEHHFPETADPALRSTFDEAVRVLQAAGAAVEEVALPYWDETGTASMITMGAEAAAYHRPDLQSRWNDYSRATRAMVSLGALVSGADYVQAQRIRRLAQQALATLFRDYDALVMPTTATAAPAYARQSRDGSLGLDFGRLFGTIFTPYWDAVGNPVLVVPMGFNAAGLPLSLQIAGPAFGEADLLAVGQALQVRTDWHLQLPPARQTGAGERSVQPPAAALPESSPQERAAVSAALDAFGVRGDGGPDDVEIGEMARGWVHRRASVDALYAPQAVRYADPALRFRADAAPASPG